jgi:hypothetical protein
MVLGDSLGRIDRGNSTCGGTSVGATALLLNAKIREITGGQPFIRARNSELDIIATALKTASMSASLPVNPVYLKRLSDSATRR